MQKQFTAIGLEQEATLGLISKSTYDQLVAQFVGPSEGFEAWVGNMVEFERRFC